MGIESSDMCDNFVGIDCFQRFISTGTKFKKVFSETSVPRGEKSCERNGIDFVSAMFLCKDIHAPVKSHEKTPRVDLIVDSLKRTTEHSQVYVIQNESFVSHVVCV